jgi:hypothetical protein
VPRIEADSYIASMHETTRNPIEAGEIFGALSSTTSVKLSAGAVTG